MILRPAKARWFELLTPREDLTGALQTLAGTQAVELQAHSEVPSPLALPDLRGALEEFVELSRSYAAFWPRALLRVGTHKARSPKQIFDNAMQTLRQWCADAQPLIRRIQSLDNDRADLTLLQVLVADGAGSLPEVDLLSQAGPVLGSTIFLMPGTVWPDVIPASVIAKRIVCDSHAFLVAVGRKAELESLSASATAMKGREVLLPEWLPSAAGQAGRVIEDRIAQIDKSCATLRDELDRLGRDCDLAGVLGDLGLMQWFAEQVPEMPASERFAWISGWTRDPQGSKLEAELDHADIRHLLRFTDPPTGFAPPVILSNPSWIRPFELFARLLGTPGSDEADPAPIVAVVAPLMFGFMFGDVGQGAIIMLAGLVLRNRYPALRVLVAGGLMSIVFGVLFGSVFAREDLIPALWLRPFDEPLKMLLVAMLLGAAVLSIGLCLAALQAHWMGEGARWWRTRAGHLLAYAGLVAAFYDPGFLWLTLLGVVWFLIGDVSSKHEFKGIGTATLESFETLFQLLINTISFVRIGAFALAHAGLGAALIAIAASTATAWSSVLILIVGNAFVIVLEGLVVAIQTTRLVLFEFFVRFLTATGRQFQPLSSPAVVSDEPHKEIL
jgi:V/A-type H+/Na+-transporting ATPase subunit I